MRRYRGMPDGRRPVIIDGRTLRGEGVIEACDLRIVHKPWIARRNCRRLELSHSRLTIGMKLLKAI